MSGCFSIWCPLKARGREEQGKSEEQGKKERMADPPLVGGKINDGRALNLAREIN